MALRMPKLFGAEPPPAENIDFDPPTTQVRMVASSTEPYDPLASMSVMDQLRVAANAAPVPSRLPVIGGLPIVRQFQVLGVLTLLFVALAAFMLFVDNRATSQQALRAATATEMQMLSQRLARSSALAAQGQANAYAAVRDSRDRFKADLDALVNGGAFKGMVLDATQNPAALEALKSLQGRWQRVDAAARQLVENERSLTSLASGLGAIGRGNTGLLELAQRAAQQIGQGGGSAREVDYANQLAMLSQRIAKNASMLASSDEIDPEMAFLLGKDATTFRDVLNGLAKGSDALKLNAPRADDARATLAELGKRFAPYDAGVNAIQASMKNLVVAKQAARRINADA